MREQVREKNKVETTNCVTPAKGEATVGSVVKPLANDSNKDDIDKEDEGG